MDDKVAWRRLRGVPGAPKRIDRKNYPLVRQMVREGSSATRRAMLSVFSSPHWEITSDVRPALAEKLRSTAGFSVAQLEDHPSQAPWFIEPEGKKTFSVSFRRESRIDWLRELRRENVLETDPLYEKILGVLGCSSNIRLSHIDFGFDSLNERLAPKLLQTSTGEIGINLDPTKKWPGLSDKHGTHCLGLLGKQIEQAELLPVTIPAIGEETGPLVQAIHAAAANGAKIVTLSFRFSEDAAPILEAMSCYPDTLFFKSAGNEGSDVSTLTGSERDSLVTSHLPNLAIVANVLADSTILSPSSNYSATHVTHAYRGAQLMSHGNDDRLVQMSGTSMAAPALANLAAKIRTICPSLTPELVLRILSIATQSNVYIENSVASGGVTCDERAMRLAAFFALSTQEKPWPPELVLSRREEDVFADDLRKLFLDTVGR